MPNKKYTFSKRAERDLINIYKGTVIKWGGAQADKYDAELESVVNFLADNPSLGRSCDEIREGLQRHESGRHIVFYRKRQTDILIIRILYDGMDVKRRL